MRHWTRTLLLAGSLFFALVPWVAAVDSSPTIDPGDKVTIKYTLTVPAIRFTMADTVSEYVPGQQQLLPGLERALMGMRAGDQKHVELSADEGFGQYDDRKRMTVAREQLPAEAKVGDVYQSAHGQPFMVQGLEAKQAVIDFNHPLAGRDVIFDVKVLKVEDRGRGQTGASDAGASGAGTSGDSAATDEATIMTLTGAMVEQVDAGSKQLRVRTQEGDNWSLHVPRPELLEGVKQGDRVSLELNSDNQVKNVIKKQSGQ